MAMPVATVDEHGGPVSRQDNVGRAGKIATMKPKAKPRAVECATDSKLGLGVAASVGTHDPSTKFRDLGRNWRLFHVVHDQWQPKGVDAANRRA